MARVAMVTRTIETHNVHIVGMNTITKTVIEDDVTVTENLEGDKLLKHINKVYGTTEIIYITAVVIGSNSTLYGMTEADFIKHAQILPPR